MSRKALLVLMSLILALQAQAFGLSRRVLIRAENEQLLLRVSSQSLYACYFDPQLGRGLFGKLSSRVIQPGRTRWSYLAPVRVQVARKRLGQTVTALEEGLRQASPELRSKLQARLQAARSKRRIFLSTIKQCRRFHPALGPTYFVAPDGNDSWSGELADPNAEFSDGPFATVQKGLDAASAPGSTLLIRRGTYQPNTPRSNIPFLEAKNSGSEGLPIVIKAYGDGPVILDANYEKTGVLEITGNYVTVEGLDFTHSMSNGVQALGASHVTIRRCKAYDNSYGRGAGQVWGYSPGISIAGGGYNLVEYSESFKNGNGIGLTAIDQEDPTGGCRFCVLQYNLVYENINTSNAGNSDGITGRWADRALIRNNVVWRNPDDGFDGLGFTNTVWLNNITFGNGRCVPGLAPDLACGNGNGWKTGVRGSGGGHVINNISFANAARGFDDGYAIGSVYVGNLAAKNQSWGFLMEGKAITAVNNISINNDDGQGGAGDDFTGEAAHLFFDFNLLRSVFDLNRFKQLGLAQHAIVADPRFSGALPRIPDIDEDPFLAPEDLFADLDGNGEISAEEILSQMGAALRLQANSPAIDAGLSREAISLRVASQVDQVRAAARASISALQALPSPIPQQLEMIQVYQRLLANLSEDNIKFYTDFTGYADLKGAAPVNRSPAPYPGVSGANVTDIGPLEY